MKTVEIPGSKSLTNRALIMAALSSGKNIISNISVSDDSLVMVKALKKLGIKITREKNKLIVIGNQGKFKPFNGELFVGDAGTALRFLTALTVLVPGNIVVKGSRRISQRPIKELERVLRKLKSGKVSIRGDISSQFISSLLMIAPVLEKGLVIKIIGKLVSASYVDMTVDLLSKFGVKVVNHQNKEFIVKHQEFKPIVYKVEGDCSGASYFWAIAAVTKQKIRVKNINPLSKQGDIRFPDLLKKMGCQVKKNIKDCWIEVKCSKILKGINVDMSLMPDAALTLVVVAAFAKGKTRITGLKTLKVKETDRLLALKNELKKIGIKNRATDDSITVFGGSPKPAIIETYNDHRMAMAFAVAKSTMPGLIIKNPQVVKKSFPEFWEKFNSLNL